MSIGFTRPSSEALIDQLSWQDQIARLWSVLKRGEVLTGFGHDVELLTVSVQI